MSAELRRLAPGDRDVAAICDAFEEIDAAGGFVRRGGGERTKPRVTPAAAGWKRLPPENP
jgi:hypothetical protein